MNGSGSGASAAEGPGKAGDAPAGAAHGRVPEVFRSVGATVMLVVGIAACCALAGLWFLYDAEQNALVTAESERTMAKLSDSVIRGVESVMLLGASEAVERYAEGLKKVPEMSDLRVLRVDGTEAFLDNKTIAAINARLETQRFRPRETESSAAVPPGSSELLKRALAEKRSVVHYELNQAGDRVMTVLHPLLNEPACRGCHGADHEVRGILKVTTSLGTVERAIARTRYKALGAAVAALALLLGLTYVLLRVVVIRRVERVNDAMNAIVLGDFSRRVPESDVDEFGDMARSFNRMAENLLASSGLLHEGQDMITAVLRSAHEGIVVADRNDDIIMANAAAGQMLGKTAAQILSGGLDNLFDSRNLMKSWRASLGDVSDEITYRGKPLQVYVSSIRGPNKKILGFALLMRDMSGEKQLREEVKRLHFTDEQTGAGNVRYLDHALGHCWSRARGAGTTVSVILFSIDTLREVTLAEGGEVAESILKRLVQVIADVFGKSTPVARMAGDTFAVVSVGLTPEKARTLAENVLALVGGTPVCGVEIWASAGFATVPARGLNRREEVVEAASRALAQAIEVGGACVRVAGEQRALDAA